MRPSRSRLAHPLLAAALAAASATCGGDEPTTPTPGGVSLAVGPAATIKVKVQPPASALNLEVWDPSRQPVMVVKDASGNGVPGVVVTAAVASGSGVVRVTTPSNARRSPPGHYLLFPLNRNGVPSVGSIVRVR